MADRSTAAGATPEVVGQSEIARENRVLRELVAVYRHLSGLALQNADVATVAQLIAERAGAAVAVVSEKLDVLAAAVPGESPEQAAEHIAEYIEHPGLSAVIGATGQTRRALRLPDTAVGTAVIVAPILVGDDVPAYLLTLDDGAGAQRHGEDISLLLTEHAATICGVIFGRERVVAAAASRVRDDLIEGLLSTRAQEAGEADRWAQHLGYNTDVDHHVLSIEVEVSVGDDGALVQTRRQRVAMTVEDFFTTRARGAITSVRDTEVVVLLPEAASPGGSGRAADLGSACVDRVGELFPDAVVTVGIGGICRKPVEIARSYAEARRTIDMVRRAGRQGGVVAFDALDIHRLLLQVPDLAELRGFATAVLGKLSSHEREHQSEYLATLACYFRENSSPQRASRSLHVHPNTVTYRIRRVEEITGLDLDSYRDRLMAQVAIEILDAVGDGP